MKKDITCVYVKLFITHNIFTYPKNIVSPFEFNNNVYIIKKETYIVIYKIEKLSTSP
jgi:hypothetical protein